MLAKIAMPVALTNKNTIDASHHHSRTTCTKVLRGAPPKAPFLGGCAHHSRAGWRRGGATEAVDRVASSDRPTARMKITVRTLRRGWSTDVDLPDNTPCLVGELRLLAARAADIPPARAKLVLRGAALRVRRWGGRGGARRRRDTWHRLASLIIAHLPTSGLG